MNSNSTGIGAASAGGDVVPSLAVLLAPMGQKEAAGRGRQGPLSVAAQGCGGPHKGTVPSTGHRGDRADALLPAPVPVVGWHQPTARHRHGQAAARQLRPRRAAVVGAAQGLHVQSSASPSGCPGWDTSAQWDGLEPGTDMPVGTNRPTHSHGHGHAHVHGDTGTNEGMGGLQQC